MAERRMFAKTIVTSDAFLDMPATTRCLYFTLAMFADDDGFVNSPKSIMRQAGASEDDLKILFTKRYILGFDSGVIVIKHWKIHNLIQKDRYKETVYLEEKAQLVLDDKNAYTEAISKKDTPCIQSVSKKEPQVSIGKDSIGKDRVVVVSAGARDEQPQQPDTSDISENSDSVNIRKRFLPPTLEEVQSYCRERKNDVDAQRFVDYYTSNGWLVGKNKMKDWKAAVRTWERNNTNSGKSGNIAVKKNVLTDLDDIF